LIEEGKILGVPGTWRTYSDHGGGLMAPANPWLLHAQCASLSKLQGLRCTSINAVWWLLMA